MLNNINSLLKKSVPQIGNLPIRQKKSRQKKVNRKKKPSAATETIPAKELSSHIVLALDENNKTPDMDQNERGTS